MKKLIYTTQFKKDLKRYKHKTDIIIKLESILHIIANGLKIPDENVPHRLLGKYKGYLECHVENDTLLIWYDADSDSIKLVRFGTHSELF
jgi:mRNA interferase YafQ